MRIWPANLKHSVIAGWAISYLTSKDCIKGPLGLGYRIQIILSDHYFDILLGHQRIDTNSLQMELVLFKSSLQAFLSQVSYFRELWRQYFETEHPKVFQIFVTKLYSSTWLH